MDKITLWCKSITALSIFSSVVNMLVPTGKMKNSFKIFTAIILSYSFLFPLLQGNFDLSSAFDFTDINKENESIYESSEYYAVLKAAEITADENIGKMMSELKIKGQWKTECEYIDSDSVFFTVTFYIDAEDELKGQIERSLREILGENTSVYFSEESNE